VGEYIRALEDIGIELLSQFEVNAERKKGFPGLWVGPKKIASIGVRVSRQVTYHGMAINISNDLQIFSHFVPCGIDGVEMTSVLKETGLQHMMSEVKQRLTGLLRTYFPVP
jgi:lipoate-protein ligase B